MKFTGQRLDEGTGLYYYGARYYDPVIGRFISADPTIPDGGNPQSFNRYSYCINNPMKYIDPNGFDYLLVGGQFSTYDGMVKWRQELIDSGVTEPIYILWDNPSIYPDVSDRSDQLNTWLANPTNENGESVDISDLKIVGHSEGACTVGSVVKTWLDNDMQGNDTLDHLTGVFLIDAVTGKNDHFIHDFNYKDLTDVGQNLEDSGIKAAHIYNKYSYWSEAEIPGWTNINVSSWNDPFLNWAPFGMGMFFKYVYHHTSAKTDAIDEILKIMGKK